MTELVMTLFRQGILRQGIRVLVLLPVIIFLSGGIPLAIKAAGVATVKSGNWSDPSVWNTNTVPGQGTLVTIEQDHTIVYDIISNDVLGKITVNGTLYFSREVNTRLKVGDNILVNAGGYLDMGTPEDFIPKPIKAELIFVLSQAQANAFQGGMYFQEADKGLWVFPEGRWDLHGFPLLRTWSKLAADASARATVVIVENSVMDWYIGGQVIVTSTKNPRARNNGQTLIHESELRTIQALEPLSGGKTKITLNRPLQFSHSGTAPFKGEVALLTRNVVLSTELTGVDESAYADVRTRKFAHTLYLYGSSGNLQYGEFKQLGHYGTLARYSTHYHMMYESSTGMIVRGNSMWRTGFRCVNLHVSHGVLIEDNVCYDSSSTAYFVEPDPSGFNQDNVFVHNIAIATKPLHFLDENNPSIVGEATRLGSFWPRSSTNHEAYLGNVSVGNQGTGKDASGFVFPENGGQSSPPGEQSNGQIPFTFVGNEAHSGAGHGIFTWRNEGSMRDLIGTRLWRNGNFGIRWGAYILHHFYFNTQLLENGKGGMDITSVDTFLQDSLVTGSTTNLFTDTTAINLGAYVLDQWPSRPAWLVRNTFRNFNTGITQIHDECNEPIQPSIEVRPVLRDCSAVYMIQMGNTFQGVNRVMDFGWQANPNSWWKVFDYIGNGLPQNFILTRKDQSNSVAVLTQRLVTPQTNYNAGFDALLTPLTSLPGSIQFTGLLNADGDLDPTPDFTFNTTADYPPQINLNVALAGRMAIMTAEATDDHRVSRVEFFVDWVKVGSRTEPPYQITVDLSNHPRRYAYLYARAFDGTRQVGVYKQRAYSQVVEIGPETLESAEVGIKVFLPVILQ